MSVIFPIIRREYLTRVKTKGFWIGTIVVPIFMMSAMFLPILLGMRAKARPEPIVIIDAAGDFYPVFQKAIDASASTVQRSPIVKEEVGGRPLDEIRRELNIRAETKDIQGYLIVDQEGLDQGSLTYWARNPSGALEDDWFRGRLREGFTRYRLTNLGVKEEDIEAASKRLDLDIKKATDDPKKQESGISAMLVSLVMVVFIYTALILYGMYVLRGVLEEKTNRIVEVIVASVRPFELMAGKILGIGAVGLTQMLVWALFALITTAPQLATALSISREAMPRVNPATLIAFPVFFVLGYFLYATLYAAIGSMCSSDEDAQQMAFLPVMLIVLSFVMFSPVMRNPNGTLAVVLSMIPFFAPILMFLRIAVETPPVWQIALCIVIMIATTVLMTWLVAKIYRVGILMYGKKPTLPEVARWIRYA